MRTRSVVQLLVLCAVVNSLPARVPAQTARESISKGIEAYHDLEFEASARLLRQVLARPDAEALGDSLQAEALGFVGAAELLLGRRQEAAVAFASALERSPTFRLDTLIFPPAVMSVFESTRRGTALVVARASADTTFDAGDPGFRVRLLASAPHAVRIAVCDADGGVARTLFEGRIVDSLWIAWDGLLASGRPAAEGRLSVCAESVNAEGTARWMRLPLRVTRVEQGSVALRGAPAAPARPPAASSTVVKRPPWRRILLVGATAAALSVGLPAAVTTAEEPRSWRFIVSGALVTTSLLASRPIVTRVPITPKDAAAPTASPPAAASTGPAAPVAPRIRVAALQREARSRGK